MLVYLIRHGETVENAAGYIPFDSSELSLQGKEDIKEVKPSLLENVQLLYSGGSARAIQTAQLLSNNIGREIPVQVDRRFDERKLPSELLGQPYEGDVSNRITRLMEEYVTEPLWHYSDEENYLEFLSRVSSALDFLAKDESVEQIGVITHAGFIKAVLALIEFPEEDLPQRFITLNAEQKIRSAGYLSLMFQDEKWKVVDRSL